MAAEADKGVGEKRYLLGIDLGSSSLKAAVTDFTGGIAGEATAFYPTARPSPGWAEQDPGAWLEAVTQVVKRAAEGLRPDEIAGIGVTGFVPGLVPLDKAGRVLRPAIMHTDLRAVEELAEVNRIFCRPGSGSEGAGISMGTLLPKLLWYKNREPENFRRTYKILNPHSYIAYALTGAAVCDYDTASITGGVFDSENLCWDKTACLKVGIDREILGEAVPATRVIGRVDAAAAAAFGLAPGIPVIAGTGDTMAAVLGHGANRPGDMMIYLGSSATRILLDAPAGDFLEGPHFSSGKANFIGRIISSGDSMEHYRRFLGDIPWSELNAGAAGLGPGAERLIVLPHLKQKAADEATFLARETIFGLVETHTSAHIFRALLEGIAYNLRDGFESIRGKVERIILCGGGAQSEVFCRVISEVLNLPVYRCLRGSGAAGVALLAGEGCGVLDDFKKSAARWTVFDGEILPDAAHAGVYDDYYDYYMKLRRRLDEEYRLLDQLPG